jgi:hypothetical protein
MKLNKFFVFLFVFTLVYYTSYLISLKIVGGDFWVYYCAGKIILNPDIPNHMVYDINALTACSTPDFSGSSFDQKAFFIYSIPAAYLLSPLALLPYSQAKALLITIELLSYAASIPILVNNRQTVARPLPSGYFLLSCLWFPLVVDITFGQINAILLLLITLAIIAGSRRPYLAGFLLGAASFFKLFPICIALILGLKNYRIACTSLLMLILGAWFSGWDDWFMAINNMPKIGVTPVYKLLTIHPLYWYIGYISAIYGLTLFAALSDPYDEYLIAALTITSLFITMPIVEYYHLVLLIIPIIYVVVKGKHNHWFVNVVISSSLLLISFSKLFKIEIQQNIMYASCVLLWGILQFEIIKKHFSIIRKLGSENK